MTTLGEVGRGDRKVTVSPRVGMFGLLGRGNTGNDGSLEAVLMHLKSEYPHAIVDVMCSGPEEVTARFGIPATRWHWYHLDSQSTPGLGVALKCLGLGVDAFRIGSWARRHDVVIVPGMGVLETSLPLRPWQTPYRLFVLCAACKLSGTRVGLVSVGATVIRQRATRWLVTNAARLASYRSFRDPISRDAMRQMGVDTSGDRVYPDVAFALPVPRDEPGTVDAVGVGVMDFYGGSDDRREANQIHASYVEKIKHFVLWLIDNGHRVQLLTGDPADERIVQETLAHVRGQRPELAPSRIMAQPIFSLHELMRQMASVDTVVATRYHNIVCALKMAKPTVSIGYAAKHDVLMADMGLSEFCQSAKSLDVDLLIKQFTELQNRSAQLRQTMLERNTARSRLVERQFGELSAALFADLTGRTA